MFESRANSVLETSQSVLRRNNFVSFFSFFFLFFFVCKLSKWAFYKFNPAFPHSVIMSLQCVLPVNRKPDSQVHTPFRSSNPRPPLPPSHFDHLFFVTYSLFCTSPHSSGAVRELRWTSWAVRPNEPSGFRGRKDLLNHASALVTTCP